jgi:2-keto-4-pentenoate hydratase
MPLGDMFVAEELANDGAVLGLRQAVGASSQLRRMVTLSVDLFG